MKRGNFINCLLGGALGDSIGLPAEGLTARRIAKLWLGDLRHRFLGNRGMVSDDTEHAVMTSLSLLKCDDDADKFSRDLARRLRWWFAGIPAGIGLATARSIIKLWCGENPRRSGVWSAGNGPMMRAPSIGVHFATDPDRRCQFVDASTRITHSDPRAAESAQMIAEAAVLACSEAETEEILNNLNKWVESEEMKVRFPLLRESLHQGLSVAEFADRFGRKSGYVSGFAPDSASVALFAWLRHRGDFRTTIEAVIRAGGDTDTVAFIAGSLAGIDVGEDGMPAEWLAGLCDWPINPSMIRDFATHKSQMYPVWPLSLMRNFVFFLIVLTHVFRRILPPY